MAETHDEIRRQFVEFARARLELLASRIVDCLERLSEEQVWQRASEIENSPANLVLHLCGNVRQWIISGVGGQTDVRQRQEEFSRRDGLTIADLRRMLEDTIREASAVLEQVSAARLTERISVQGANPSVLEDIFTVVAHFAEHTGQVIYMTKHLTGEDLGYSRKWN